ncbi:MAG: OmpA family protein [Rickettsiales bacterium]|jgi:peptidoglycan-associated lipoprotein|nr:OmpA family protein [Rickettsiales bacterium]
MKKLLFLSIAIALAACAGIKEPAELDNQKAYFAFDSAEISKESKNDLLGQSLYMKNHPNVKIIIEGHCDERGSSDYNLALGALRAGNAAHILIKDGIESERIKTISYGKENPQFLGTGEEVWSKNRNATTRVKE